MNYLEDSLIEALADAHLPALPEERRPLDRRPWLRAIVLVDKGTSSNYALASSDGERVDIVRDYGASAIIRGIKGIYPYVVLDSKLLPKLKTDQDIADYLADHGRATAPEVLSLLSTDGKDEKQAIADRAKVNAMVAGVVVKVRSRMVSVEQEIQNQTEARNKKFNILKSKKSTKQ